MGDPQALPGPVPGGAGELALPDVDDVVEGDVVDEGKADTNPQRPVYVLQVINVAVSVPRATVHHAVRVPAAGLVIAWRKWLAARSLSADFGQLAKAQGDHDKGLLWAQQAELERKGRSERRNGFIESVIALVRLSPFLLAIWLFLMILAGICLAFAHHHPADMLAPWKALADAVAFAWSAAMVAVWVLAFGVPVALYGWFLLLGRRGGAHAPGWSTAGKPDEEDRGLVVTADTIVAALRDTPVSEMKKKFREGWQPVFHTLPIRDGLGYFAVFSVPMGVTASMLADQVEVFARNIHRAKCETWITDAERAKIAPAGYVALWAANPGVLDRPAPEYPLLHDGQADVFEGVPGGVVARGDGALIPVVANNGVWGGQMGMGKSNAGRVYILGCCTDPLCEVEVFVFASNGDYDEFAPRLALYVKGTDDATAAAAVNRLHELLDEVGRREARLAQLGAKKLTRRIAEQHTDMRPLVVLFSECHDLFGHAEHGEMAAELAVKVIKRARKTGITLCFDTQSSRAAAIPPALVELVSVNACFYVKTWRSNDGFLGDGSFQGGIRATELRPNRDVGRSVVTGISDAQFELLKWYLIEVDDDTGWDAATEVIARCMKTVAPGTRASRSAGASLPVIIVRDLLDDLREVVEGPERVNLRDAVGLLRRLDGAWYRSGYTAKRLREDLAEEGVRVINTSGTFYLDPADLHRALDGEL